jgi:hypothetical protein
MSGSGGTAGAVRVASSCAGSADRSSTPPGADEGALATAPGDEVTGSGAASAVSSPSITTVGETVVATAGRASVPAGASSPFVALVSVALVSVGLVAAALVTAALVSATLVWSSRRAAAAAASFAALRRAAAAFAAADRTGSGVRFGADAVADGLRAADVPVPLAEVARGFAGVFGSATASATSATAAAVFRRFVEGVDVPVAGEDDELREEVTERVDAVFFAVDGDRDVDAFAPGRSGEVADVSSPVPPAGESVSTDAASRRTAAGEPAVGSVDPGSDAADGFACSSAF